MLKMSKQNAIIFILVVFLGALGALLYFYFSFSTGNSTKTMIQPVTTDTYNPFGTIPSTTPVGTTSLSIATGSTPVLIAPNKLRQISTEPESGFTVLDNPKAGQTDIHYILRANGNIYEAYADTLEQKRLSITTVPKVYESMWLPDGIHLIIRYLKDDLQSVQTFSVKINPATTTLNEFEGGITGNHLDENVSALAVNPKGDKLFYLENNLNGSSGFVSPPTGLSKTLLFQSPLVEWNISWPNENVITFTTKPSANVAGYLYFLNSQTGIFSRIIGGINGLTTKTNVNGNSVLYSDSIAGAPKLYLYDVKKGASQLLPWNTFPEKCAWSNTDAKIIYCAVPKSFPAGNYPDDWYQSLVGFTDDIWMINTDTSATTLVYDMQKQTANNIDAVDLQLDKTDSYLFFTNKSDLTLWDLKLK